ncbi:DUF998 domain-containing protein [Mycolicibacterium sp. 018/SC-01/001]|uniref:DUF998 domain-containing protein n=1 Tax=Mycolicibacterium sp. 018/SC-01/001 TaxID=2592069 RepID=UPI00163D9451|nr:DUF998 domain-containing protein [Mycolicibacterium sp. 018/SC-01/001]
MRRSSSAAVRRAIGAVALAAGISYLVVEALAASRVAAYSYADDYVSDLGRATSPLAWWMNAGFRVQGMAFVVTGAMLVATVRPARGALTFTVFACLYGAGSVTVGLVPSGGPGHLLHVGGATAAILGGNLALITAGRIGLPDRSRAARALGYGLGLLGLTAAGALIGTGLPSGACERTAIYSIIAWQLLAGARLLSTGQAGDRRADARIP